MVAFPVDYQGYFPLQLMQLQGFQRNDFPSRADVTSWVSLTWHLQRDRAEPCWPFPRAEIRTTSFQGPKGWLQQRVAR